MLRTDSGQRWPSVLPAANAGSGQRRRGPVLARGGLPGPGDLGVAAGPSGGLGAAGQQRDGHGHGGHRGQPGRRGHPAPAAQHGAAPDGRAHRGGRGGQRGQLLVQPLAE